MFVSNDICTLCFSLCYCICHRSEPNSFLDVCFLTSGWSRIFLMGLVGGGGGNSQSGIILQTFCRKCMKRKGFGGLPGTPLRSTNANDNFFHWTCNLNIVCVCVCVCWHVCVGVRVYLECVFVRECTRVCVHTPLSMIRLDFYFDKFTPCYRELVVNGILCIFSIKFGLNGLRVSF